MTYKADDGTQWDSYEAWWTTNGRDARRQWHKEMAQGYLASADDWIDVDEETMARRGYGYASTLVELANLHLRIRDLI